MFFQIRSLCQIQKVLLCLVCVCVDLSCQSFVIHLLPRAFWMAVRQSQTPGGKRILLQGCKPISNQANQCHYVDRLMGAVMDFMSSWPFCHAIVIYIVRPYHLIAILQYYTLLGQFVRTDCLFILHSQHQLVWRTDVSSCVFGLD